MEVTYQYHYCKNIASKSYQLFYRWKKLWLREYASCRALSGRYISRYHFCAFLIPGKIFAHKTRTMCLTSESSSPCFSSCLPTHSFLRLFVELNRMNFSSNCISTEQQWIVQKKRINNEYFHLFQDKNKQSKTLVSPAEACGILCWAQVHPSVVRGFLFSARPLLLVNRGWVNHSVPSFLLQKSRVISVCLHLCGKGVVRVTS